MAVSIPVFDRCQQYKHIVYLIYKLELYDGYHSDESIWAHCPANLFSSIMLTFLLSFVYWSATNLYLFPIVQLEAINDGKKNCKCIVLFCVKWKKKRFPVGKQLIDFPLDQSLSFILQCMCVCVLGFCNSFGTCVIYIYIFFIDGWRTCPLKKTRWWCGMINTW
jgi:hypothetical protein